MVKACRVHYIVLPLWDKSHTTVKVSMTTIKCQNHIVNGHGVHIQIDTQEHISKEPVS